MVRTTNYREAFRFAHKTLQEKLDLRLVYHNVNHTENDVVFSVMRMCELIDLSTEKRKLLITAAWFHDIGYIEKRVGHEKIGIELVKKQLPEFGFSDKQILQIVSMINATKIPQSPKDLMSKILADADLDNLGRKDFFKLSKRLLQEINNFGENYSEEEWWKNQLEFLKNHTYFTSEAKSIREQKQNENIILLEKMIAEKNYQIA
jgi:uncharacterized protein